MNEHLFSPPVAFTSVSFHCIPSICFISSTLIPDKCARAASSPPPGGFPAFTPLLICQDHHPSLLLDSQLLAVFSTTTEPVSMCTLCSITLRVSINTASRMVKAFKCLRRFIVVHVCHKYIWTHFQLWAVLYADDSNVTTFLHLLLLLLERGSPLA